MTYLTIPLGSISSDDLGRSDSSTSICVLPWDSFATDVRGLKSMKGLA